MIYRATIEDLDRLMDWRMRVIAEVFEGESFPDGLFEANKAYYERHLADGTHVACFAERDGDVVGCGGLCLQQEMPSPENPSGRCGYIMNIYVDPAHRTHGLGHEIVRWLIREAHVRGVSKIYLETTVQGKGLYESLGFKDMTGYMRL